MLPGSTVGRATSLPSNFAITHRRQQHHRRTESFTPSAAAAATTKEAPPAPAKPRGQNAASLSTEDVQRMLRYRGLDAQGSRPQLVQRLRDFMADPGSFPQADCRPRPVVLLGGRLFACKAQLRSHIQMLLSLLQGTEVEPGHPHFAFLSALLQQHPRYAEKVQPPVQRFRVSTDVSEGLYPLRWFDFMDARGEWEDFSYRKCIGMEGHNADLSFRDAMRQAVLDQLVAYRTASSQTTPQGARYWRCDCCGQRVRQASRMRVGHVEPSFQKLINDFRSTTSLAVPPIDGRTKANRGCFTDQAWLEAWRKYHRRNARTLELHCMTCIKQRQPGPPPAVQWPVQRSSS